VVFVSDDLAVRVKGLGKKYRIGGPQEKYHTFRDAIANSIRSPLDRLTGKTKKADGDFWALKDVSFEVHKGEVIGIIGRNGAGKSTLLKILSRITTPTEGCIELHGRVGSLLEVGTGFHPELTGRENIFLSGSILGMRKREIEQKFDEIVKFSEIEKFLDTPVKRYSSGMYVRLAFAVAAHMDMEILLVDEVLAVGDAQFQKKCMGKMGNVAMEEGKTVLFVSHNMSAITSLCTQSILLDSGQVVFKGNTSDTVLYYLTNGIASPEFMDFSKGNRRIGNDYVVLLSGSIRSSTDELISEVDINESFKICMEFKILKETKKKFLPQVHFFTSGTYVFAEYYQTPLTLSPGSYHVEFIIPANFLNDLTYFVSLGMASLDLNGILCFYEENALSFNVRDSIENTPGARRAGYMAAIPGQIRPQFEWTIRKL